MERKAAENFVFRKLTKFCPASINVKCSIPDFPKQSHLKEWILHTIHVVYTLSYPCENENRFKKYHSETIAKEEKKTQ